MIELKRSDQVFELNLIKQKLEDSGIPAVILDEHSGSLMQGIGGISPRLMVLEEDAEAAQAILDQISQGEF